MPNRKIEKKKRKTEVALLIIHNIVINNSFKFMDKYGIKEVCAYKQRKEFTIPISLAGGKFR